MGKASLKDFQVGQEVWIERRKRAARNVANNMCERLYPAVVEKVGRKYVVVSGKKFEEPDFPYGRGMVEHGEFGVESILYPSYDAAKEYFEVSNARISLIEALNSMTPSQVSPEALKAACEALGVSYERHTLSGYEEAKLAIDSFHRGGAFKELPFDFASYAYEYLKVRFTEEDVRQMNESDVYAICKNAAKELEEDLSEERGR